MQSQGKKKGSFFQNLKGYFSQTIDVPIVINEATVKMKLDEAPQNSKTTKISQEIFKIDNEYDENEVYEEEEEQPTSKSSNTDIMKDYKIIKIHNCKPIGKPIVNGYSKKQKINFPPESTFRIVKPIKTHKSLIDYLSSETERHLALDGGWLYIMNKISKDQFLVSSATQLCNLKQIFLKIGEEKPTFRLIFQNKTIKRFYLADEKTEHLFFLKLRTECLKHSLDFCN